MLDLRKAFSFLMAMSLAACSPASLVPISSTVTPAIVATATPQTVATRPNIVFILTDDLDWASMPYLPKTNELLGRQGASLENYFVSMALCCPSRACILRGQYPHNTQILGNQLPDGGFEKFHEIGDETSTVAVWLQQAGYRTALIGKYLNGYPNSAGKTYLPPGWTEWYSAVEGKPYTEYNYTLNENGKLVGYGKTAADYGTDVYAAKALDFMQRSLDAGQPFFVYLAPYAPHGPSTPAPRHAALFPDVQLPQTASFNEADVSDKPQAIRQTAPLGKAALRDLQEKYRLRLQSLQAVDEMVAGIVETLQAAGQLDNTYLFFMSDNGFHLGQHRLKAGKNTPYEEDIRVPLLVRGPGIAPGTVISALTGNIDLAPTWTEIAGASVPDFVDGRSLLPLLKAEPQAGSSWRQVYLLEKGTEDKPEAAAGPNLAAPAPSAAQNGLLEPPDDLYYDTLLDKKLGGGVFRGLRTTNYTYVEYINGEVELYDLRTDPDQLQNIASTADRALLDQLRTWLAALKDCKGATCRSAENVHP